MFSKAIIAFIAAAAVSVQASEEPTFKTFGGHATWFDVELGAGACGAQSVNSDFVVAISTPKFEFGHCWDHLKVTYQGTTIDVTVVDECTACTSENLDLSPAAFEALAPLSVGIISTITWHYT